MKRSIVLALAGVPMMLATGMASTAYAADVDTKAVKVAAQKESAPLRLGLSVVVNPGANATATVLCPAGSVATGGGGVTNDGLGLGNGSLLTFLTDSHGIPAFSGAGTATGWSVSARNNSSTLVGASTLQAYVICEPVSGS
jgi:hypothetical protein